MGGQTQFHEMDLLTVCATKECPCHPEARFWLKDLNCYPTHAQILRPLTSNPRHPLETLHPLCRASSPNLR
jgi:hypothetical protein